MWPGSQTIWPIWPSSQETLDCKRYGAGSRAVGLGTRGFIALVSDAGLHLTPRLGVTRSEMTRRVGTCSTASYSCCEIWGAGKGAPGIGEEACLGRAILKVSETDAGLDEQQETQAALLGHACCLDVHRTASDAGVFKHNRALVARLFF